MTWDPEAKPLIGALVFDAIAGRADAAGGLTLGADPIAGAVAYYSQTVGAPIRAFTVRKQAKAHGMARAIEGSIRPGDRVAIVDDVVTTGHVDARRDRSLPSRPATRSPPSSSWSTARKAVSARIRDAVPGVPCSALFTRAELQRRLEEQRATAR